jgi:uncharacterized protein YbcI
MSSPDPPLHGDELLTAVTEAMVAMHERYHHRVPTSAKTQLLEEDLLAVVMGGVYTDVEKTMIELQRAPAVQETRSAFQEAMQDRFIKTIERLSGREVLAFISNSHVGPDIEIELFVLRPPPAEVPVQEALDGGRPLR